MGKKVIGIDVGTNSIGWAVIDEGDESKIVDLGVRIFQEAVTPKDRTPKNAARRQKRMLRKITWRRAQRKRHLESVLRGAGLLPARGLEWDSLFDDHDQNPYALRKKALDEPISLYQLGRVLFHLCLHRGFKSNRKAMLSALISDPDVAAVIREEEERRRDGKESKSDAEKEEGLVLKGISQLSQTMEAQGERTLGEHLANLIDRGERARRGTAETANYSREMVEQEFEAIWRVQAPHHKLSDGLRAGLFRIIFFQRPLKIQRFTISACPLVPGRKCAMKAQVISQQFRIWQTLNNIRVTDTSTGEVAELTPTQKLAVAKELQEKEKLSWSGFRKAIGNKTALINLEEGGDKELKGDKTSIRFGKILGARWNEIDQDNLVHDIIHGDRLDAVIKRLRRHWGFTPEEAYRCATTELDSGTTSLSAKAMRGLLAHLQAGKRTDEACVEVFGKRDPLSREGDLEALPLPPDVRNPVVNRALHELRKVINAIHRTYGPIDVIRLEMARDLKLTKKQKDEVAKQNRANEKLNAEAREQIMTLPAFRGSSPSHADLEKYRLWVESDRQCPYTGRAISLAELYGPDIDVEHIIPYPRCWDNSFNNKTLCDAPTNRAEKKNQTPVEAFSQARLDEIRQRLETMPMKKGKKERFFMEWNDDASQRFLNRQLTDTGYISRFARSYLAKLVGETNVQVSKGSSTALMRHAWGLDTVLGGGGKNREDHRHHAVDALVVALISRGLFQQISRQSGRVGSHQLFGAVNVEEPIPDLRNQASKVLDDLIVSHQVSHKTRGSLHEDTAYGRIAPGQYVYRKAVATLTAGEIARVRDPWLRKQLERVDPDTLKKEPFLVRNKYGKVTQVMSVRLVATKRDEGMVQLGPRYHPTGGNHHVAVYENADGERRYRVVSTFEVAERKRSGRPIYAKDGEPGFRYLGAWHAGDTVEVEGRPERLYRVVKFSDNDEGRGRKVYILVRPVRNLLESESKKTPDGAGRYEDILCSSPATNLAVSMPLGISVLGKER